MDVAVDWAFVIIGGKVVCFRRGTLYEEKGKGRREKSTEKLKNGSKKSVFRIRSDPLLLGVLDQDLLEPSLLGFRIRIREQDRIILSNLKLKSYVYSFRLVISNIFALIRTFYQ
jgi:hypothetical protein